MKLNNFVAQNALIQKPEQIKTKNLLLSEKIYLESFKKLSVLNKLTPYTRLEPQIKSGRTIYTIKPMLGRTYRSVRFLLDSIKTKKQPFFKKIRRVLEDPMEAQILKRKFQSELLEARLNLRTHRKRKKYIKKKFSLVKPPYWFKFKNKNSLRSWIANSKKRNFRKIRKKTKRKLARRYIRLKKRLKKRLHSHNKLSLMKKSKSRRWLAIYELRFKSLIK